MPISVDPIVLTLRHHAEGGYGSGFDFSVTVQLVAGGSQAYLSAAEGRYSTAARRELNDALWALGVESATWERRRNGSVRKVVVPTRAPSGNTTCRDVCAFRTRCDWRTQRKD